MSGPEQWNDQRIEVLVGRLLQVGVSLSAAVVFVGGCLYLWRHHGETAAYGVFHGEPDRWRTLSGLFTPATFTSGRSILMVGILLLILTPVARVAFSLVAFALERDRTYCVITAIVLALLISSLTSA